MNRQIIDAFDQIIADQDLIDETKKRLREQRSAKKSAAHQGEKASEKMSEIKEKKEGKKISIFWFGTVAAACLVLGLFLGFNFKINSTPVSYLSIDVNPSIELCLNEKDKVISADAWNSDGEAILSGITLKGKTCKEAVECLLGCEAFQKYLKEDCDLNITVIGASDLKVKELQQLLQECKYYIQNNGTCVTADMDVYEEAHGYHMSFGKYLLYKELHELDHAVSVDDCQHMTVKEIKDQIYEHENHTTEEHKSELHENELHENEIHESELHESEEQDPSDCKTDNSKKESHEEDQHEIENHETESHEEIQHEMENHETESHEEEWHEAEEHETESHVEERHEIENHEIESHEEVQYKEEAYEGDCYEEVWHGSDDSVNESSHESNHQGGHEEGGHH